MGAKDKSFQQELHLEFLKALHDEKTKAQGTRAAYTSSKFAFITGLFGLGALKIGMVDFHWLLYLIPWVALGYDLYIRAEDLSIKKMGAFLRSDPKAKTAESERAWERFSAQYRDKLAHVATTLFTLIITISAAVYIYAQQSAKQAGILRIEFWMGFIAWFTISFSANVGLWASHQIQIKKLDKTGSTMGKNRI
ncbi:MAG: hypothetical protein QY332_19835 [Anaerolineales bacterium]|nr:MAG: hypothetical protein QY332_19835 [Anaerolineales bacterium]